MTFDQKIQIWNTIGTWIAGLATVAAVVVALYLSGSADRIKISLNVGLRKIGHASNDTLSECVDFETINLSHHPVTITTIGWRIGRGKNRRFIQQNIAGAFSNAPPMELEYGKRGDFMVDFSEAPNWLHEFSMHFDQHRFERDLKSLRACVWTSVGQIVEIKPEQSLLAKIRSSRFDA